MSASDKLIAVYRDGLLHDTLPFWFPRCADLEHGGFFTALDRDGAVIDTDKAVWQQGRTAWLLATLYNTVERRAEWLDLARHGVDFILNHAFDKDGRMFFLLTREGKPLRKRRYVYSEAFAAMALAAYAKAAGDDAAAERARRLFQCFLRYTNTPGLLPPKVSPENRPAKSIGPPMIALGLAQVMRENLGNHPDFTREIDRAIREIQNDFVKPDVQCVMETVGPEGQLIDHFDGRTLNPGHAIEAAWFILHEASVRGRDAELIDLGCRMLDWMWVRGWDTEHGGILYFVDVRGLPVQEYWHDMKFWWPHNETVTATLLAHALTGDEKYAEWHRQVHDWAYAHFPDPEHGEWFGYLHRDGTVASTAKGNTWKGPFHLPRMQLYCWKLLQPKY